MKVGALKKELEKCNAESEVIIFVTSEGEDDITTKYRPFKNINVSIMNKDSSQEQFHLDVGVNTEYKNAHFPNNLTEEEVLFLKEKRKMLLEELEEVEEELGEYQVHR